eukprot:scaffold1332_cov166-Amphora_coffeaeformis.AAC.19
MEDWDESRFREEDQNEEKLYRSILCGSWDRPSSRPWLGVNTYPLGKFDRLMKYRDLPRIERTIHFRPTRVQRT